MLSTLARLASFFIIAANLLAFPDDTSAIRDREHALSEAMRAKNRDLLSKFSDRNFSFHVTYGCAVRSFDTTIPRQDWLDNLVQLRADSYRAVISKIDLLYPHRVDGRPVPADAAMAYVTLDETWTIHSPQGSIEEHLVTVDGWAKAQDRWILMNRTS